MVAYSFRPRFVEPILWGRKHQTIRAIGKRSHAQIGDALQLYTGMRTKQCRLILRTVCVATFLVKLRWRPTIEIKVKGVHVAKSRMDDFARDDGFANLNEMQEFWEQEHPGIDCFHGLLIRWQGPSLPVEMGATIGEGDGT